MQRYDSTSNNLAWIITVVDVEERPVADRIDDVPHPAECKNLIGHDDVIGDLFGSYKSGRMHHAWLFNGPRGIGKASTALTFAKYILSNPDAVNLPEEFDHSAITDKVNGQIAAGAHPDLLHLTRPWDTKTGKFKTKLSVEEVRRTQSFYGMTAGGGGWRITIVDATDDMNVSAANALLKILEEPPKRSLFFVLNHTTGRLLPTIRSRCRSVNMPELSQDEVLTVINNLGVQASDADKSHASNLSNGSARRAIQLLHGDTLQNFRTFEKIMNDGAIGTASEWLIIHKLADSLSRKGQEDNYHMFLDLVISWIGLQVRNNPTQHVSVLAGWAEVWDKANRSVTLSDAYNLDKKQVILTLFHDLFERK